MLTGHRAVLDLPLAGLPPADKGRVGMAKIHSGKAVPILESILYPEGD